MPRPKGLPKTGGRQRGTRNKHTVEMQALAVEAVRRSRKSKHQTPLEYVVAIVNDPNESPERRLMAASMALPYLHPRLSSIEQKTETIAEVRITQAELAAQAVREIEEAFREWTPPLIEHRSVDAPATLPPPPEQQPEPERPPRDYAADHAPPIAEGVPHFPSTRYRSQRGNGSGWSG